jgi:hypothetical protein
MYIPTVTCLVFCSKGKWEAGYKEILLLPLMINVLASVYYYAKVEQLMPSRPSKYLMDSRHDNFESVDVQDVPHTGSLVADHGFHGPSESFRSGNLQVSETQTKQRS